MSAAQDIIAHIGIDHSPLMGGRLQIDFGPLTADTNLRNNIINSLAKGVSSWKPNVLMGRQGRNDFATLLAMHMRLPYVTLYQLNQSMSSDKFCMGEQLALNYHTLASTGISPDELNIAYIDSIAISGNDAVEAYNITKKLGGMFVGANFIVEIGDTARRIFSKHGVPAHAFVTCSATGKFKPAEPLVLSQKPMRPAADASRHRSNFKPDN